MTEMPVCTRLVVPLLKLATLKLPQIRELGVYIDGEHGHIWEKHIAVSANLSGLKLLHLRYSFRVPSSAIVKILGLLPALETLITDILYLDVPLVHFFETFVPMIVPGPSGRNRSSWEEQISGVVCPRLESLQIEGIYLPHKAKLMPVLKNIVTLRAMVGSPLKSFTFYYGPGRGTPQMWHLIGREKSFMMEEVVPATGFQLDV